MKNRLNDKIKSLIYICTAFSMFFCSLPSAVAENQTEETQKTSDRIIVSMGDSYSSGEGIDDFYDYDKQIRDRVKSRDWLAHRSQNSWGGQLTLSGVDGTMKEHKDEDWYDGNCSNWYFTAASGATTGNITNTQNKDYYKLIMVSNYTGISMGAISGSESLPAQNDVFKELESNNKKADYVTITIGGNDMGFSDIITAAVTGGYLNVDGIRIGSYINVNGFADLADMLIQRIQDDSIINTLKETYRSIHEKSGAKIIVAGYPKLLEQTGKGALFNKYESELINNAVHIFNFKIHSAVLECNIDAMSETVQYVNDYYFVSVEEGFDGHEAYSDEPYINSVEPLSKGQDIDDFCAASAYSMHPNEKGAEVYRACVQAKIDELERTTSDERDVVLVLDTSGSMSGKPIDETKKAATNFISTVLQEDASIGIVTYSSSENMLSDFSINEEGLKKNVENIDSGGGTNMESGLAKAEEMLSTSNAKKKIIVLMSDGLPNDGKQGEDLISYADSIKDDGAYIYTLGFFESAGGKKSSAQELMERIASDGCHYEVTDADDLKFFLGDIADQINGQKYIYIRIACPVDVKVTYEGETLSSLGVETSERTNFGTLTFEEGTEESEGENDDRTKILRLKEGANYDIKISGNGIGKMNYSIGFMDENGEYSDMRKFNGIEISSETEIVTVANTDSATTLNVDSDGDGKYDLKYKAKANGIGEIVDYSYIWYMVAGVAVLITLLVIYIWVRKLKKRMAAKALQKKAMQKVFCIHCGYSTTGDKKFCPRCGNKIE